ncbi:DUF4240 domain-containing protein [Nitrosomonas nitrosa]|uniref:DUF4240 domain-containing protein n=1 Tax=Nitrosomonas nitrosa TaxID=52442 RepID=UPI0023F66742|nr:DUF4240 domain-containing protein [Nitrosomonas nitrosa]MCO6433787.1 DUF4240 domain-containing protein [Nitrosomonas nitrosa]
MNKIHDIPELDNNQFWSLVLLAKQDFSTFKQKLEQMSQVELISFVWKFQETAGDLYDEKYLYNQYSEDYMADLCDYVVGQGREFYEYVRNNPDQMPQEMDYSEPSNYIKDEALEVYSKRFDEPMPPL